MLTSCSSTVYFNDITIFALDTVITIKISDSDTALLSECSNLINYYERLFSRTIPESDISRFNDSTDGIDNASEYTTALITLAIEIADETDGKFNPVLEPITTLWQDSVPETIDLNHIDYTNLSVNGTSLTKTDPYLRLDLGAIAKGYICEKVTDYLIAQNVDYGVLSFGGNISAFGTRPDGDVWSIGIRDPYNLNEVVGYLNIDSGYVSVSGDYQRYFEFNGKRYHHIIDPSSGYPTDNDVNSVAVWCENGTFADALSTALFVMGVDEGMEFHASGIYEFEVMYITKSGITMSDGFKRNFVEKVT